MKLNEILPGATSKFSDRLAVIEPQSNESISYENLLEQVVGIQSLLEKYVPVTPLIALCADKSIASLMALLAILQHGAAYVPMDAHGAKHRNLIILNDCQPGAAILTQSWADTFTEKFPLKGPLIPIPNTDLFLLIFDWKKRIPLHQDLACILYTSGSTGRPKGVQITHENAWTFIDWATKTFPLNAGEVCTSIAPFHFDLSVFDLYFGLSKGASILLINQKNAKNPRLVAQWFSQYQVHTCYATPSFLKLLFRYGRLQKWNFDKLRQVLFAGEIFDIQALRELQNIWAKAHFFNLYGPTETNVVTYFPIPDQIQAEQQQPFPIGKCCSGSSAKIWTNEELLNPKDGLEGELAVTGSTVSPGYLGLTQKNRECYIRDESGVRFYLTGDWVKVDEQQNFIFKGRKDRMVKRRGYRIELAEIEQALSLHPLLAEVACIATESQVKAYCCPLPEKPLPTVLELNQFLMELVPAYMLPDLYIQLKALPQTSTQKIDYQKLTNMKS